MDLLDEVRAGEDSAKFLLIKSSQREARFEHFWARASEIVKIRSGRLDLSMGPGHGSGAPGLLGPFPGQDPRMPKSKATQIQAGQIHFRSPNRAQAAQIQPGRCKSSPGKTNPVQADQIQQRQSKSTPSKPNPAQAAQIQPRKLQNALKSASGRILALFPGQGFKMLRN